MIELLVVIAIVVVLITLLLPGLQRAQELANRHVCRGNHGTISKACLMYAEDNDGWPPRENRPHYASAHEYPTFHYDAAPYWGGKATEPRRKQPWWSTTACPSFRQGARAMQIGQAIAVNSHICAAGAPGKLANLHDIEIPSEVALTVESHCAYQPGGLRWLRHDLLGSMWKGTQIGVYPRHWREGLNFGLVDGHVSWLGYYSDPASQAGTFLPRDPRLR